jgi:hypothetical protein
VLDLESWQRIPAANRTLTAVIVGLFGAPRRPGYRIRRPAALHLRTVGLALAAVASREQPKIEFLSPEKKQYSIEGGQKMTAAI